MNKTNLDEIISEYILRFNEFNDTSTHDEGYKWRAVSHFQENWDIDAADFPAMFNSAMSKTENLINNSVVQPLGGIQMLLKNADEVEFVRQCFKDLFSDDGGDIIARQDRIISFMDKINKRIDFYYHGSHRYPQSFGNALFYLNLWRPEENYIYKYTEATDWANCIEFSYDFGSGKEYSLGTYYRMCDELLAQLPSYPELIQLNSQRKDREMPKYDDKLHLLVWDIICCASKYILQTKATIRKLSTKQRIEAAQAREEYEALCDQEKRIKAEISQCVNSCALPNLIGESVTHKVFKAGSVIEHNGNNISIQFTSAIKKFLLPDAVVQRFISFENSSINDYCSAEYELNKTRSRLLNELDKTHKQMNDLKDRYEF